MMNKIYGLFYEQVQKEPEKIAVIVKGQGYSYRQLSALCDTYIQNISRLTQGDKALISVSMHRGAELIAAILAILQCGCAYLPIDQELPMERIKGIFDISRAALLLTDEPEKYSDATIKSVNISNFQEIREEKVCPDITGYDDADLAYVIFTSGSTGFPKGVSISNKALLSFFYSFEEEIHMQDNKRVLAISNYSFDMSFVEMFMPLLLGLTVILADDSDRRNPRKIWRLIARYSPDLIQITPSYQRFLMSCESEMVNLNKVKKVILGGECVDRSLIKPLLQNGLTIYNAYGPTEATIWCSVGELTDGSYVHVGHPLKNTQLRISGERELLIAGDCLFSGYYNDESKTAERCEIIDKILYYHSGDIVKTGEKGELIITGRKDNQIKLDGHRVELEDIESNIREGLNQLDCAVGYYENKLILFYVSQTDIKRNHLFHILKNKLPTYMIPQDMIRLDSIPLNSSRKVNRAELQRIFCKH